MRTAAHPNPCTARTRIAIPNANPGDGNRTTDAYGGPANGDKGTGDRHQGAAELDTGTAHPDQASSHRNDNSKQHAASTNANCKQHAASTNAN
jgi:hypothetical protein